MIDPVEHFLARLRSAHPLIPVIFRCGGCYELYLLLREVWPDARPWHSDSEGHVYVEVDGRFYDILGRCIRVAPDAQPMPAWMQHQAHRWHRRLSLGRCVDIVMEMQG